MLQLKNCPDQPVSTREEAREFHPHPEELRFRLLAREEGSFPCVVGKEFPGLPSHFKRRHFPQERLEELQGRATITRDPRCLSPFQGNLFSLHYLEFKLRIDSHNGDTWVSPVGKPRGKASWESLVGKHQGKGTDPLIHANGRATLLLQLGRKAHVHSHTRDEG